MTIPNFQKNLDRVSSWYSTFKGLNAYMIMCLYDEFKPYIRQPLLEIGAADGYMTQMIVKDFNKFEYDIVEGSSEYATKLKQRFPQINVHCSLLEEFQTKKKYQTIIASHVLEHVENPVPFLKAIKQLLLPQGQFLVSVPNANSFHRLLGVKMGLLNKPTQLNEQDKKIGHYRVYDPETFKNDLKSAGFRVDTINGSFIKFLSNYQTEQVIPEDQWQYYQQLGLDFPQNGADIWAVCAL